MRTRLLPILSLFALCTIGCAGTMHATTVPHRPEYRLVVKAPKAIIGNLDPKEYTFTIVAKAWGDKPSDYSFDETTPAYCILRGNELACLISVHEMNAKFELEAHHIQPDPRSIPEAQRIELAQIGLGFVGVIYNPIQELRIGFMGYDATLTGMGEMESIDLDPDPPYPHNKTIAIDLPTIACVDPKHCAAAWPTPAGNVLFAVMNCAP
ncbi:hypothetical protein EXS71_04230 [Candidatus Uhrbacteria bacterium]|nr:hypothetical protein [Candidatus Uhrbacteria bacterium]